MTPNALHESTAKPTHPAGLQLIKDTHTINNINVTLHENNKLSVKVIDETMELHNHFKNLGSYVKPYMYIEIQDVDHHNNDDPKIKQYPLSISTAGLFAMEHLPTNDSTETVLTADITPLFTQPLHPAPTEEKPQHFLKELLDSVMLHRDFGCDPTRNRRLYVSRYNPHTKQQDTYWRQPDWTASFYHQNETPTATDTLTPMEKLTLNANLYITEPII